MNYINNKVNNRYRSELGNFIGNYKKWDYIVGLSYRDNIRNEKIGRIKIKNLFKNLSKYDENIDGVYVNEYIFVVLLVSLSRLVGICHLYLSLWMTY